MSPSVLACVYEVTRRVLTHKQWAAITDAWDDSLDRGSFPDWLDKGKLSTDLPAWVSSVARIDWCRSKAADAAVLIPEVVETLELNPTLSLLSHDWLLSKFIEEPPIDGRVTPKAGPEYLLIWRGPRTGTVYTRQATPDDLLALKIVSEGIAPEDAARQGGVPMGRIDRVLYRAIDDGLLVPPPSKIRRDVDRYSTTQAIPQRCLASSVFTLQWHITHACDLSCKHCYDRSKRHFVTLQDARTVLEDLHSFCWSKEVRGHVSFSGGNPFLHPNFEQIYAAAADHGFATSILANPVSRERLERIVAIQRPRFFQVSLEGLQAHNDIIRGPKSFANVVAFLDDLREVGVEAHVMLTLTRDNMGQVLELGEFLRHRCNLLTFNRLSQVGEGANLAGSEPNHFESFLREYVDAASKNPILGLKENLLNIIKTERGEDLFGGCTGFGCGAAFNFLCLLPDGEVHACRKFPSLIGQVKDQKIGVIYDSDEAKRYRSGCTHEDCRTCKIRAVCGGCMAVTAGMGKNPFSTKDPYCFMSPAATVSSDAPHSTELSRLRQGQTINGSTQP